MATGGRETEAGARGASRRDAGHCGAFTVGVAGGYSGSRFRVPLKGSIGLGVWCRL